MGCLATIALHSSDYKREHKTHQIVVIGGSTTALSLIDSLLTCAHTNYLHITLVAPAPLHLPGPPASPAAPHVARLALDQQVRVLHGRLEGLNREERVIEVDGGHAVPYDLLVLATGLQVWCGMEG